MRQAQAIESELGSELSYRILGNAHEDVVTALEAYLKTAYRFLVRKRYSAAEALQFCSKKAIQNSFQNIERGERLFRQRLNIEPFAHLEPSLANDYARTGQAGGERADRGAKDWPSKALPG